MKVKRKSVEQNQFRIYPSFWPQDSQKDYSTAWETKSALLRLSRFQLLILHKFVALPFHSICCSILYQSECYLMFTTYISSIPATSITIGSFYENRFLFLHCFQHTTFLRINMYDYQNLVISLQSRKDCCLLYRGSWF